MLTSQSTISKPFTRYQQRFSDSSRGSQGASPSEDAGGNLNLTTAPPKVLSHASIRRPRSQFSNDIQVHCWHIVRRSDKSALQPSFQLPSSRSHLLPVFMRFISLLNIASGVLFLATGIARMMSHLCFAPTVTISMRLGYHSQTYAGREVSPTQSPICLPLEFSLALIPGLHL